jgi:heptose I phosphotransferase
MIILPDSWKQHWGDSDWFEKIFALQGEEFRNMDGRRTLRFELLGKSYFVKMYQGLGWWRIVKSLMTLRKPPVMSAHNEWLAIRILTELGIETMTEVAYGERGRNPARRQSFLVTEDLHNTVSLEDFCRDWKDSPPDLQFKRQLISRLGHMAGVMHAHGINHRDYYLCHFLLEQGSGDPRTPDDFHVYLIDLHRVQFRASVPQRWLIKDLASLHFSAMDIGLTRRDYLRFLEVYSGKPWRDLLDDPLWAKVDRKAVKLYQRFHRKYA